MENSNKPFLSYKDQIARLKEKGISCEKTNEKKYLIRKGYFNLINGYEKPFISGKHENGNHKYLPGTSIKKIYRILKFDRRLSDMLLKNITHVEEEISTIAGYKIHLICTITNSSWSDIESYDLKLDKAIIKKLIKKIKEEIEIAKNNNNDYIIHYSKKADKIPIWIMTKIIKFTTLITFIQVSKKSLREYLCDLYDIEYISNDNDFGILMGL